MVTEQQSEESRPWIITPYQGQLPDPPWERLEGESIAWYDRFNRFLLMGPNRSLSKAATLEQEVANSWSLYSRRYRWIERAEAWDEANLKRLRLEVEQDRLLSRKRRIETLNKAHELIDQALLHLVPEEATFRSVMEAITMVFPQLRIDYDDEPKQRVTLTGPNGEPIQVEVNGNGTDYREVLATAITNALRARANTRDIIELDAIRSEEPSI